LEEKQRPNANYELSKPDDMKVPEEGLNFHYSRERRLAKAPQEVKNLYTDTGTFKFDLFRPLVADRPRKIMFASIILLCAIIFFFNRTGFFDDSHKFEGNKIEIRATRFEETAIIVLKKNVQKGFTSGYSGAVDIAVSPAIKSQDEEASVFYHRIFFSAETAEEYRFVVPWQSKPDADVPELLIVLQTEKNTLKMKIKPE
jgi:hypothetical protein